VDDEEIARAIASKLKDAAGISYTEIASKALECGRTELATRLLDYEPKTADQVPLLMRMKKDELALQKAIESGDTDLVYTVVMHMKDAMSQLGEFFRTIRHLPEARSLFIKYCKEQQNHHVLVDMYYQYDQFLDSGNLYVQDSYAEKDLDARLKILRKARMSYSEGQYQFAEKATLKQIDLIECQKKLKEQHKKDFLHLSLSETMRQCILLGHHKFADQLKKEFEVPERRYYWLKVYATAEARNWLELERFSKTKKSPIGYEPFVEACVKYNARVEAEKYIPRVSAENKVKCLIQVGDLQNAAQMAFTQHSIEKLDLVHSKCGVSNRALADKIQEWKEQLAK